MKHLTFVSAQFFLLSLSFAVFFDPIGISYFLFGFVYMLNRKLAIFETALIFLLKGSFGFTFTAPAWANLVNGSVRPIFTTIFYVEIPIAALYGAILAVQISAKMMKRTLAKKAPDLLGMIGK